MGNCGILWILRVVGSMILVIGCVTPAVARVTTDEAQQLADRVGIMDLGRLVAEGIPVALIDELGADTIRILGSGSTGDIADRFSAMDFVQSVAIVEGGFLLGIESASRHLAEVVTVTTESGFTIEDISVAKPDLGAVFFKHTGRQLRDEVLQ